MTFSFSSRVFFESDESGNFFSLELYSRASVHLYFVFISVLVFGAALSQAV